MVTGDRSTGGILMAAQQKNHSVELQIAPLSKGRFGCGDAPRSDHYGDVTVSTCGAAHNYMIYISINGMSNGVSDLRLGHTERILHLIIILCAYICPDINHIIMMIQHPNKM